MEWHLHRAPFPPLQSNDDDMYFWCAQDVALPALWPEPTRLIVQTSRPARGRPDAPSGGQGSAFAALQEGGAAVRAAALRAMFEAARDCGRLFSSGSADELAGQLSLSAVRVLGSESHGTAYVGLQFYGLEYEHGFGVILHRDHVVHLAVAEEACDEAWTGTDAGDAGDA